MGIRYSNPKGGDVSWVKTVAVEVPEALVVTVVARTVPGAKAAERAVQLAAAQGREESSQPSATRWWSRNLDHHLLNYIVI